MTINYKLTVKANIILDDDFTYSRMADRYYPLIEYIDKARFYMGEYGFVQMENDCNDLPDDDEPAYYDDDDSCGYE